MLAAEVWHWWIGIVLLIAGVGSVAALVAGYLKNVSSQRYPSKRQREL
jgi:formate-dependent nitrite reductase membrane component NrfD